MIVFALQSHDMIQKTDGNCVDRLSLVLALSEDRDERIEEAVQIIPTDLWEELRWLQRLVQRMSHTVLNLLKK